jgi:hypothetical protein
LQRNAKTPGTRAQAIKVRIYLRQERRAGNISPVRVKEKKSQGWIVVENVINFTQNPLHMLNGPELLPPETPPRTMN